MWELEQDCAWAIIWRQFRLRGQWPIFSGKTDNRVKFSSPISNLIHKKKTHFGWSGLWRHTFPKLEVKMKLMRSLQLLSTQWCYPLAVNTGINENDKIWKWHEAWNQDCVKSLNGDDLCMWQGAKCLWMELLAEKKKNGFKWFISIYSFSCGKLPREER